MRRLLLSSLLFLVTPVNSAEITSRIVDSVQLTVDGPALQTTRIGGQYSVSGTNINVTSLGGWNGDANGSNAPDFDAGVYDINTNGQAFNFSENILFGDSSSQAQNEINSTTGRVDDPRLYSDSTQYQGGTAGSLAGTLSATGTPTVTAGGSGSTVIGQRTIELTVFK